MPSLIRRNPDDPSNPYRAGQRNSKGVIICGAKCRNGSVCQDDPIKGYRRCRKHGGKVKQGTEHHNSRHMLYSKAVRDANLEERYKGALADPELVGLQHEIALMTTHIQNRQTIIDMGVTDKTWKSMVKAWDKFYNAYLDGDEKKFRHQIDVINEIIEMTNEQKGDAKELIPFVNAKRSLVAAEQRRMVLAQQMVTVEDTMTLLTAMMVALREAAYLYTSKQEADQIIGHAQGVYKKITGSSDEKYLNIVPTPRED